MMGDTECTISDPEGLRLRVDRLTSQWHWTEFASAEQINIFDGPEKDWELLPNEYLNISGFDDHVLRGPVPPPGIFPRLFFSPEDVPNFRKELQSSPAGSQYLIHLEKIVLEKTMGPGNEQFRELARGNPDGALYCLDPYSGPNGNHALGGDMKSDWPRISHVPAIPFHLSSAALYCLLTEDDARGESVANAIVTYFKMREPLIDHQNERGRDPNADNAWPSDLWRGMAPVCGHAHLGLALDFAGKWMTPLQIADMTRIIAKSTSGKRAYGQNGSRRWRDTNWVGWDLEHNICATAIEGLEGFDENLPSSAYETLQCYFAFGISGVGTILETNGKNGAGLMIALSMALILARRGHNLLGHPHLRQLCISQVHHVKPAGNGAVNNGTYGCSMFGQSGMILALYPEDPHANFLYRLERPDDVAYNEAAYRKSIEEGRHPGFSVHSYKLPWPETVWSFHSRWKPSVDESGKPKDIWDRSGLHLPLDFADEQHGVLTSRSGDDPDALFVMTEARCDKVSLGHEHHDSGHFYISAFGLDWADEGSGVLRSSQYHSVVLIDGVGQGSTQDCSPARADWMKTLLRPNAAYALMNLKHAYDYVWTSPMHYSWNSAEAQAYSWEPETHPDVVEVYRGTQQYKARVWMDSYWHFNWGPIMRAKFNPVQHAFRSITLIRGSFPFVVILDDICKADQEEHLYQWQMQVPPDLALATGRNQVGLATLFPSSANSMDLNSCPQLAIFELAPDPNPPPHWESVDWTPRIEHFGGNHSRLIIPRRKVRGPCRFAFLLVPLPPIKDRSASPSLLQVDAQDSFFLRWHRQPDEIVEETGIELFPSNSNHNGHSQPPCAVRVTRDGQVLLDSIDLSLP